MKGAAPATVRDNRSLLCEPGQPHKRGRGVTRGRIMERFGDVPIAEITMRDVSRFLADLNAEGMPAGCGAASSQPALWIRGWRAAPVCDRCRVRGVHDDWRLQVTPAGSEHAEALSGRLEAEELGEEVMRTLGDAIAVSRDGQEVFLYADTHAALRAAERIVRDDLARHGWSAEIVASRWHEGAEDWEPADAPAATTAAQRETEHARLMQREDAESAAFGFPEFEARATLPTRHAARDLSERLTQEGIRHVRRWRHVIVGADDEDAARAWADRLRTESPAGTDVTAEGTFAYVERAAPTPFKGIGALGGGMP